MTDKLISLTDNVSFTLCLVLSLYVGISTFYLFQDVCVYQSFFLLAVMVVGSLEYLKMVLQKTKNKSRAVVTTQIAFSILVLIASAVLPLYIALNAPRLQTVQPFINNFDVLVGCFFIALMLFLVYVHWGVTFTIIVIIAISYFIWGHLIPNESFAHPPYDMKFAISYLGMNATDGFFTYVSMITDQLYFLLLFASILLSVGILDLASELGKAAGRKVNGGAAFPAIFGSTAVGTVMGVAVSNVAMTGQITIPMMKKYGFRPELAGAVEAVASTAGQIIPPVLGLAGFMIAAFLNIPYIDVAIISVVPALLYLLTTILGVINSAGKDSIGTLNESVNWTTIYRLLPTFLIPFTVVLALMLYYISPSMAGLLAIPLIYIVSIFQGKERRPKFRYVIEQIRTGHKLIVFLSILCVAIGPFAQVITITQIAPKVGTFFMMVLPESLFFLLILTAVVCTIVGMGLPTPVAYLLVALTLCPFLQMLGVPDLQAHFFVFYFACFSAITPPIALACLAASQISGASFIKTAIETMKLAFPNFVFAFAFIYNPSLLHFPEVSWDLAYFFTVTLFTQFAFGIGFIGFFLTTLKPFDRLLFIISALVGISYLITHSPYFHVSFWVITILAAMKVFIIRKKTGTYAATETLSI